MAVDRGIVDDLGSYMNLVSQIAEVNKDRKAFMSPEILWFRGQSNVSFSLIPSIFRTSSRAEKKYGNYTNLHYAEDIRTQHYIAKNYHLLSTPPSSRVEWLEVMQHHQVNTRVLDWSESSLHALLFALEPFFDGMKYKEEARQQCRPCVWVLKPGKVNKNIVSYLSDNRSLQRKLLADLKIDSSEKRKILDSLKRYADMKNDEVNETRHINYIFNLSSINDEILNDRVRLKELLKEGEVINPYFYLLSRIYSDGFVLDERSLPPLCVVHPYHSERIKAQRGVFSVFPFYKEKPEDKILRKHKVNPDAFEHNKLAEDSLYQIIIKNPQEIARQLMLNGMNHSWLYPEMPVVSSEIENRKIL